MNITNEEVRRFQEIWKEEFGEEISEDEARSGIRRLDTLFLLLARRRPSDDQATGQRKTSDTAKSR